ncbi:MULTISPECIES: DUF3016 domain-containing protein [Pseudoalteromonas]|uniref:DUF3016 domain-containing protein n=1 Tax=Pseudoalteromonas TaxID=53246 RepID=UPI0011087718|nr:MULTISPECIES: DUF3016 domain-containing protein [Pseudoalteromonas]MCG9760805.1 DUF3016 domain-containing protein [Pseudoalteromonas sp. Isolate6]NKC17336.1 DUF3016 domain-containing protein [Pseudoalteromonas galatheae]
MKTLIAILALLMTPLFVNAGEVAVTWKDFKEYRDVRPGNETRGSFHKRVEKQLTKHLEKLAEKLPAGHKLAIHFDEIDLAGDVHYGMTDIRVIKPIHFPRFEISYKLTDKSGNSIAEESGVKLKDMSFMDRVKVGLDEPFYYEKRLLTDWFEDDLMKKTG